MNFFRVFSAVAFFAVAVSGCKLDPANTSCVVDTDCAQQQLCSDHVCADCPQLEDPNCDGGTAATETYGNQCSRPVCRCPDTTVFDDFLGCVSDGTCQVGTSRCSNDVVQTCDGNGAWQDVLDCTEYSLICSQNTCQLDADKHCGRQQDCTGNDYCVPPGTVTPCGTVPNCQMMCAEADLCAQAADCGDPLVYVCAEGPPPRCNCACNECFVRCNAAGGSCNANETCNEITGMCFPTPCDAIPAYACTAWMTCNPNSTTPYPDDHGCIPFPCTDNSDCPGGACVLGSCYSSPGICSPFAG